MIRWQIACAIAIAAFIAGGFVNSLCFEAKINEAYYRILAKGYSNGQAAIVAKSRIRDKTRWVRMWLRGEEVAMEYLLDPDDFPPDTTKDDF